ncbi:MAG: T9SS type A sorting domain-containing protein [Chitinophagales bacterium]|nr:T9SS type A sorting domain-containing protein [Chitinophagales bacterium]
MKKLFLFITLWHLLLSTFAQYVTIPDTAFRAFLKERYPICFNINDKMDTTCSNVLAEDVIAFANTNVINIEGIQYFKSLVTLYVGYNKIDYIPELPKNITYFYCNNNFLNNLPDLPSNLTYFDCSFNNIEKLPVLPDSLVELHCSNNIIDKLEPLPKTLKELVCDVNLLDSLPLLNDSLIYLSCNSNKLSFLPPLPSNLHYLSCSDNHISQLPVLPLKMTFLSCYRNNINELTALPNELKWLDCAGNNIEILPELPSKLEVLKCEDNKIKELTALPDRIFEISCTDNNISFISNLPKSLQRLWADRNNLVSIPAIPDSLVYLNLNFNQILFLPPLPSTLEYLSLNKNLLSELPSLPNDLKVLQCCCNEFLQCLPILPYYMSRLVFSETNVTCLPNDINPNATIFPFPIPDVCTDPSEICQVTPFAKGIVFHDVNLNGVYDSLTERVLKEQIIEVEPNHWISSSNSFGGYIVKLDTGVNNLWRCIPTYKYANSPETFSLTPLNLGMVLGSYNFGIQFESNIKDLNIHLASLNARPGYNTFIFANIKNEGTINQDNIIAKLKIPTNYNVLSTSLTPTKILNDTLFWENLSIDFQGQQNITVELQVPENEVLGTELLFEGWVSGMLGDTTPLDNYFIWNQSVTGSFDPNDKLVNKERLPFGYDAEKDKLLYTIRFQNTGNDTAFTVVVRDVIEDNLDINTIKVIQASHPYQLLLREKNIIEFAFPNIQLVDSGRNEPLSHGLIQFSIQAKEGLVTDVKIKNNADIFFDYNAPVKTNTVETVVKVLTTIADNALLNFKLFPNPSKSTIRIELPYTGIGRYLLSDIYGRIIETAAIYDNTKTLDLDIEQLPAGNYFITVEIGGRVSTAKLIKM